jgi:hypothetical protein
MASNNENEARQPCAPNIPCVPYFYWDKDPLIYKECPKPLLQNCYKPRLTDEFFYNRVNWQILAEHFEDYMTLFAQRLSNDVEIAKLLQETYTYGPYPPEREWETSTRPPTYADLEARVIKNDDYLRCYNLMANLVINRGVAARPGITEQIISHISFHPRKPKYYRDSLRSRSGCGYYNRPDGCRLGEGEESHPTDSGPFHYTINTVSWGEKTLPCEGPNIEFLTDQDPSRHGTFLSVIPKTFEEDLLRIPIVFQEKKLPGQNGVVSQTKARIKHAFEQQQQAMETTQALANAEMLETEKEAIRQQAAALAFNEERIQNALKQVTKNLQQRVKEREKAKQIQLKANQNSAVQHAIKRLRIDYLRNEGIIRRNEENNVGFARYETERIQQQRRRLNLLHLLIFREFIEFWNTVMFPLNRIRDIKSLRTGKVLPSVERKSVMDREHRVALGVPNLTLYTALSKKPLGLGGTRKKRQARKKTRRLRTHKH